MDIVRIEVMRQTHGIHKHPKYSSMCLGQVGITPSEAPEGGVVCSAAMGQLGSLLLDLSKARLLPWLHMEQALLLAVPPLVTGEGGDNRENEYSSLAHAQRFIVTETMSLQSNHTSQLWQRLWISFLFFLKPTEIVKYKNRE